MLYVHLFGYLRVFDDERPLQFVALPKTLPLWAYLLLNRTRPVPRDTLAYLLWPDTPESVARANLRRHLHELRQALPPTPQAKPWLLSQAGTLQWNPAADYWLDVAEFEHLSASPDHLAKAAALYIADLLPNVYDDWILVDRERLRSQHLANLGQLVAYSRARGDSIQAIVYTQQILSCDPLREDAVRELISLRYQTGDRAGALQAYQDFARLVQTELGATPMPETNALHQAVAQNSPILSGFPAAPQAAPVAYPHNLPAQLNPFFGREQDLQAVLHLIEPGVSQVRLLTLTGPAGVGKTRLAIEAAAHVLPHQAETFPDGIFFVDLSAIRGPHLVAPAIAETLRVKESNNRPLLDCLKGWAQPKRALLLLDNFEQVIEAGHLVTELLGAAPNLRVLVTSRSALQVYGEQEYPVPPLPLPSLDKSLTAQDLGNNAAVALFVARAHERAPDFDITDQNAAAVAQICICLDGLPLAIELAARHIKSFSPASILEHLARRLAFLTGGPRDQPTRHQTLREAIGWSYQLLDEEEKILFASLGVFAGGCTATSAQAVCGPSCTGDLAKGLAALLDKSLIQQIGGDDEPRFGMLASIREYALEQLEQRDLLATMLERHAEYYADLAEQAHAEWRGPQQVVWVKRLNAEVDNLRAVLAWSLDETADVARAEMGANLACALGYDFWQVSGRIGEGRGWCEQALIQRGCLSLETIIRLLNQAGWLAQLQGEYPVANAFYQDGLTLARRIENAELLCICLHSLGVTAGRQGDYERAEVLLAEAITVEREISAGATTPRLATLLNNLAIVAKRRGDYARAAALLQESLDFKRAQGDQLGIAASLVNLGNLALAQKDFARAEASFRESLVLRLTLGDKMGIASALSGLADLALVQYQLIRSVRLYGACEALRHAIGFTSAPGARRDFEHDLTLLREQLGEADFAAAWAMGASMTLDQAAAYALGQSPPLSTDS